MNVLDEQRAGRRQTGPERGNRYRRPGPDPLWDLVVEMIRLPELPVTRTAAGARVSTGTVELARDRALTATTARAVEARAKLTAYAVKHARKQLHSAGVIDNPRKVSPPAVLAHYLEHAERPVAERRVAERQVAERTQPQGGDRYRGPGQDPLWDLVVEVIRLPELPVRRIAAGAGVSTGTVELARDGALTARTARAVEARAKLTAYAVKYARKQLGSAGVIDSPRKVSPPAVLARYLEHRDLVGGRAQTGQRRVFASARHRAIVRRRATALGVVALVGLGLFAVLQDAQGSGRNGPTLVHNSSSVVVPRAQATLGGTYSSYLRSLGAARRAAAGLQGIPAAELQAVITNVTGIAARGLLTPSRIPVLSLTLDRNREWWSSGRLLAPHQRVQFPGSRLVWQYYPGQGIELSAQASFATAHVLCTAGRADLRACTELLSELIALGVNRSGRLAWEYYFNFDGGLPPWTSALSQGTALQAFADAYKATKNRLYLAVGNRALALFTAAPPSGVAVQTPLGARYVEYSFDPARGDEVLNAFLKSLIGLDEYAQVGKSPLAARLFAAGNAEAQAELPQFDTGFWSLYQPGVQDSVAYHELVIKLLNKLCAMDGAPIYCTTASNFASYLKASPAG